jgi:hypothetical protein
VSLIITTEDKMELLPIFKTSLILFMIVMSVLVSISYIMYKIRHLKQDEDKAKQLRIPERTPVQQMMVPAPVQREQSRNISHRAVQSRQRAQVQPKPRERFLIVNQQQADIRIYQTEAVIDAPFYHPRSAENNKQFLSRKPFDLFENYSTGGEKLHRLHVA